MTFLQKLGCHKTCWDSSSLVNKQVDRGAVTDVVGALRLSPL